MECLVFLPHSYAARGPAESCIRAVARFAQAGIAARVFVVRARARAPGGVTMIEALPLPFSRLPFRLIGRIGRRLLRARFARAIDRAAPGSIAWFWPDAPSALVRRANARGLITIREMINSPLATAKPILDAAYHAAGLVPAHGITADDVERETEELGLYSAIFASNPEVEKGLAGLGISPDAILSTTFGWVRGRLEAGIPPPEREDRPFRACFVGLMNVRKGIPVLLRAWQEAGIEGELWLAGTIEPALAPMVDAAIAAGGVRHVGQIADVASFYRQCDVFVFPTHEEGGPQVTYEAASCGLPAITTPMGAARIIEDGRTGLVVAAGDVSALSAALRKLAGDRALARRMGDAAREAAEMFEYDRVSANRALLLHGHASEYLAMRSGSGSYNGPGM